MSQPTIAQIIESDDALEEALALCYADSSYMAKLLFPDAFRSEFDELHYRYFDFIDHCECPKKGIVAPRGFIKTTGNRLLIKKNILFQDKKFIGYLTNSGDVAVAESDSIKADLLSNPTIGLMWRHLTEAKPDSRVKQEKWAEKMWIAHVDDEATAVLPRGYGQQVNGLIWLNWRPDLWIADDLEDRVEVRSEEQRKKLRTWFYQVLLYTVSQYESEKNDFEIIYTDTIKHPDALMCHLMDDPDWEVCNLPVCDDKYHTLAPHFKSQETLDKEIEGHRLRGDMDIFAMEQQGLVQSKETKEFKISWLRDKYYSENDEHFVKHVRPRLVNAIIYDPSKTKKATSAETGIVVWGFDFLHNAYYVRLAIGERMTVGEQQDKVIELAVWYKVQALGMETTGLEDHLLYPFINECQRRKLFWIPPIIITLDARSGKGEQKGEEGGKEGRISLLYPYFEKGLIYVEKDAASRLEQQLLGSRLRDVADAAAYMPQLLMKGQKFMAPPSGDDATEAERLLAERDAYASLTNEPSMRRVVFD